MRRPLRRLFGLLLGAAVLGGSPQPLQPQEAPQPAPAAPAAGINAKTGQPFPRGAKASPRFKLQSVTPHKIKIAAPAQFAIVPPKLSYWYNDTYGICVTAQEAFSKAVWSLQCGLPELFVPDAEVLRWATKYGFRDGADLSEVMDQMQRDGFNVSGTNWKDGPYNGVDYSNESILQNAIFTGPVNIAIDANALPSGAGNVQGWYSLGNRNYPNTDHCVALCGYGPAEYLYKSLNVTMPAALAGKSGYLLFTWSTIGFVDHSWLMKTCVEAWVRNPTTPGQSPQPPANVTVPNVVGKMIADAKAACAAVGLSCDLGPGADANKPIVSQAPAAGASVPPGSVVIVTTGTTPPPQPTGDVFVTVTGNVTTITGTPGQGEWKLVPKGAQVITGDMTVTELTAAIIKAGLSGKKTPKP